MVKVFASIRRRQVVPGITLITGIFRRSSTVSGSSIYDGKRAERVAFLLQRDLARLPASLPLSRTTGTRSCTARCFCLTATCIFTFSVWRTCPDVTAADDSSGSYRGTPTIMFSADADGNLWVPSRKLRERASCEKYPAIPPPFQEEYVLKISPDGIVLPEFSILDAIFYSRFEGLLFRQWRARLQA